MLWLWLGKEGCYQLLCRGIKTCRVPVGWTAWLCCLPMVPSILVLRIVSLHHIRLGHFVMVHAVVCLLCVGIVSKLFARSLAWKDEPGICCSPNPMLFRYTVCLSSHTKVCSVLQVPFWDVVQFFADVFHAKVINNQCKLHWSCVVFSKARY